MKQKLDYGKEDRTLPESGICRYCGGSIWKLDSNVWKCGHCLRLYSKKGDNNNDSNDQS